MLAEPPRATSLSQKNCSENRASTGGQYPKRSLDLKPALSTWVFIWCYEIYNIRIMSILSAMTVLDMHPLGFPVEWMDGWFLWILKWRSSTAFHLSYGDWGPARWLYRMTSTDRFLFVYTSFSYILPLPLYNWISLFCIFLLLKSSLCPFLSHLCDMWSFVVSWHEVEFLNCSII